MDSNAKIWCWVLGIIAVAIIAIIIFCKVVYWLIWIGAVTVLVLIGFIIYYARKGARSIENDIDS